MLMKLFIYLMFQSVYICPSVYNLICGVSDIFNIATVVSGSVPLLKAGHSDRKLTLINDRDLRTCHWPYNKRCYIMMLERWPWSKLQATGTEKIKQQTKRWRDRKRDGETDKQMERQGQMVRQNTPLIINLWGKISRIAVTLRIKQMFEKLCVKQFGRWYTVNSECFCVCV